jgi:hypothetical protein
MARYNDGSGWSDAALQTFSYDAAEPAEEADDESTGAGNGVFAGTLGRSEQDDTLEATGKMSVSASASGTEDDDSIAASGWMVPAGTLAYTEANDAIYAIGIGGESAPSGARRQLFRHRSRR